MTDAQFSIITTLIRCKPGQRQDAAQWVLVGGATPRVAAGLTDVPVHAVYATTRRIRAAEARIRAVSWV